MSDHINCMKFALTNSMDTLKEQDFALRYHVIDVRRNQVFINKLYRSIIR